MGIEYEVRLGVKFGHSVSSDIGSQMYERFMKVLENSPYMSRTINTTTDIYYNGNIRSCNNYYEIKNRMFTSDHKFNRYNIRFSISEEQQVLRKNNLTYKFTREKYRSRYEYKMWFIDLTHIKTSNSYELEIELKDPKYGESHSVQFVENMLVNEMEKLVSCTDF